MNIKAENTIDKHDVRSLINCSHSSLRFMLILLTAVFASFLIFCIAVGNTGKNTGYCIVGIIWCTVVYVYSFAINPVIAYRSFKKKYSDMLIKFKLSEKKVTFSISDGKNTHEKTKKYVDMFKVYETDEYFFFYLKRNKSYIMKKSGIYQGTASDITETLTKEMGVKFIRKVKNNGKI